MKKIFITSLIYAGSYVNIGDYRQRSKAFKKHVILDLENRKICGQKASLLCTQI